MNAVGTLPFQAFVLFFLRVLAWSRREQSRTHIRLSLASVHLARYSLLSTWRERGAKWSVRKTDPVEQVRVGCLGPLSVASMCMTADVWMLREQ